MCFKCLAVKLIVDSVMGIKERIADCVLYKDMKKFGGPAK